MKNRYAVIDTGQGKPTKINLGNSKSNTVLIEVIATIENEEETIKGRHSIHVLGADSCPTHIKFSIEEEKEEPIDDLLGRIEVLRKAESLEKYNES